MFTKKNIILIDDHILIRNGLKELVEKLGQYRVSEQFGSGGEFLASISDTPDIDLVILDINMPGMGGVEVMEALNERGIKIPVLVLTVSDDEDVIIKLFRLGVRGYLMKNCEAAELKSALNEIFQTGYYHNEFLTYSLRTNLEADKKSEQEQILDQLTDNERDFLKLVCDKKEYTYDQIADIMNVQHRTVDGYREAIFEKFGIKSKAGLVLFVLWHKLFDYL